MAARSRDDRSGSWRPVGAMTTRAAAGQATPGHAEADRAQALVARLARGLAERPGVAADPEPAVRRAAVALVLRPAGGDALELLFIKRAEHGGDPWSGHVAFPGGRWEAGDETLEDTAVRETWEETAVGLRRDGRVLGVLDDLRPRTPTLPPIVVRPYVAVVDPAVRVVPNPEVAAAFWVPLAVLLPPEACVSSTVRTRGAEWSVPSFRHGEHVIWGMTERLLQQLLTRVREAAE
jgi:8-oxo-dGTP pyrophosphatase MutT (NUDIX family)